MKKAIASIVFLVVLGVSLLFLEQYVEHVFEQRRITNPPTATLSRISDTKGLPQSEPEQGDLPKVGDQILEVGTLSNGTKIVLDVTSASFDPGAGQYQFVLILELGETVADPEGDKLTDIVEKDVIDCYRHRLRILNMTGVDDTKIVSHVVMPEMWIDIPQGKNDNTKTSLAGTLEHLLCPEGVSA
jgi:hypothetical protein